ncbi:cytochrome c [Aquibium sp. A9E412]|uniref:c-type cytochrome n=1 Tax=Aquibium sp. A9E412 TaxID=2976767 RepID=UPI0025AF978C|nr:cytochrome c [Aquibium sp. A9E412]MDN2566372.1 cytochrome c [Aquibium sp. A9E412]
MKKAVFALSVLALSATATVAADDPIAVRKALMQANAGAAGVSAAMLKGEMDYNPAVAKAALATFYGVASAFGDYFPEGSDAGDTRAAPAIWEDMDGFQAAVGEFRSDAMAGVQAAGENGPADREAFQAAVGPVLENCRSCHEDYQLKRN